MCQGARSQMLPRITVCGFFYAFRIRRGLKEDNIEVGESKAGIGSQSQG